jgi:hypothetical protein
MKVKALARTYAQTIQGSPVSMKFDPSTSLFVFTFVAQPSVQSGTIIFAHHDWSRTLLFSSILNWSMMCCSCSLHDRYYPRGAQVDIQPSGIATSSVVDNQILISRITSTATVTITVRPL